MKSLATWKDRYLLGLKEELTIKEIMKLRDCGEPKAVTIRELCLDYCLENNIPFNARRVPTEVVFLVTNKNLDYYYNQMLLESRAI